MHGTSPTAAIAGIESLKGLIGMKVLYWFGIGLSILIREIRKHVIQILARTTAGEWRFAAEAWRAEQRLLHALLGRRWGSREE